MRSDNAQEYSQLKRSRNKAENRYSTVTLLAKLRG